MGGLLRLVGRVVDGLLGGSVSNGNWQVVIPPGAYKGSGTVSLSVPNAQPALCDISISPASLNGFDVPVQLSYKVQPGRARELGDRMVGSGGQDMARDRVHRRFHDPHPHRAAPALLAIRLRLPGGMVTA